MNAKDFLARHAEFKPKLKYCKIDNHLIKICNTQNQSNDFLKFVNLRAYYQAINEHDLPKTDAFRNAIMWYRWEWIKEIQTGIVKVEFLPNNNVRITTQDGCPLTTEEAHILFPNNPDIRILHAQNL